MLRFPGSVVRAIAVGAVLFAALLLGCAPGAGTSSSAGTPTSPRVNAPPSWFASDAACQFTETSAQSRGDPHSFDSTGKSTGLLPQDQVTCLLEIQVCGDMLVKQKVVNTTAGEKCPDSLHFSYAPATQVCCAKWKEAKRTKTPCDPLVDADCDGAANDADTYPLDFSRQ
jgi:hypothetical protein